MSQSISKRGLKASKSILRVDMDKYYEAIQNLYHAEKNPQGTFPLNMAENKLNWPMLRGKLMDVSKQEIPDWVAGYTSGLGARPFREAVARFLETFLTKCPIDPDRLAFSAGATSVVEMTSLVLGDPGDVVCVPAPCYPVYKQDIGNIAQLQRYDILTHHDLTSLQNGPILGLTHLEEARQKLERAGKVFKILILTNPDNPTGGIYPYEKLLEIAHWCLDHQIHLIVNEIYGLSLIDTDHPELCGDYKKQVTFVSFARIMQTKKSDYLHLWYSFSKDFGISGFRVGFVYSYNELFIRAYQNLNYSHLVSNHSQWQLQKVLEDKNFVHEFLSTNQILLTKAYVEVVKALRKVSIPYIPSRGSLFVWLDLSEFLENNTLEEENSLWLDLYEHTGILLTPGEGFGHSKKGHFRMVYPYFSQKDLKVAMSRFCEYVIKKRS